MGTFEIEKCIIIMAIQRRPIQKNIKFSLLPQKVNNFFPEEACRYNVCLFECLAMPFYISFKNDTPYQNFSGKIR